MQVRSHRPPHPPKNTSQARSQTGSAPLLYCRRLNPAAAFKCSSLGCFRSRGGKGRRQERGSPQRRQSLLGPLFPCITHPLLHTCTHPCVLSSLAFGVLFDIPYVLTLPGKGSLSLGQSAWQPVLLYLFPTPTARRQATVRGAGQGQRQNQAPILGLRPLAAVTPQGPRGPAMAGTD